MVYSNDTKPTTTYTNDSSSTITYSFLLQENGSYLLQENGDKLIISQAGGSSVTYTNDTKVASSYSNDTKPS